MNLTVRVGGKGRTGIGFSYPEQPSGGVLARLDQPLVVMDGFGACDRNSLQFSDAQADFFFTTGNGCIGLSLLRTPIYSDGSSTYATNHQKAAARGAKVWAAPWSAPGSWKDSGTEADGGHLLLARYDDWATRLADLHDVLQSEGVNLYAISVQGEPNWQAGYPSMLYSASEMVDFVKVLGPKMAAKSPAPLLILPETIGGTGGGFSGVDAQGYISAVMADGTAAPYFAIAAQHQYNGVAALSTSGRPCWQTEMSSFETFDATMTHGLTVAGWIHDALVNALVSAWHYWEILGGPQSDNESLVGHDGGTQTTKRSFVLGNWAKFVRPGHHRVATTGTVSGVNLTAFVNPTTHAYAIVAVNTNGSNTSLPMGVFWSNATSVTPWLTSASADLAQQSVIPCVDGLFTATLPASSVTTFVGGA